MKKIILAVMLVTATLSAKAWYIRQDQGVLLAAAQNYTPETRRLVQKYVGEDLAKPAYYLASLREKGKRLESKEWHTLHLNANLQPNAVDDKDAYVQIERALDIIRNHKQHSEKSVRFAIHMVMNLVIDMHIISNVAIEGVANSGTDFQFTTSKGSANGRPANFFSSSWKEFWTMRYVSQHGGYTPTMWADEIEIIFGAKKAEFMAGTLADWANDIGHYTKKVHGVLEANGGQFLHAVVQAHEELHMSCMARAAYRIAALLNENLK